MESIKTVLIVGSVFLTASIQNISLPLVVHLYESIYFVLIMNSLQFIIITAIITLIFGKCRFGKIGDKRIIFLIGLFNAITAIFIVYSADTSRTPAIIQSILGSTNVIPSVFFTKVILGKKVIYNWKFILPSIFLLTASLVISCIPIIQSNIDHHTIKWICVYFVGILAGSLYNIMQEKYFITMQNCSIIDKLTLMFFVTVSQIIILICMCWFEIFFGYTSNPIESFVSSVHTFIFDHIAFGLMQLFIVFNIIVHLLCLYSVQISANYTIIAIIAAIPSIGVFFFFFPSLNVGIKYHWYEIFPCILCSILAIILWLKGEKHNGYEESVFSKIMAKIHHNKNTTINESESLLREKIDL